MGSEMCIRDRTTDGPNALPAFSDACTSNCDLPQITVEDIKDCSEKKMLFILDLQIIAHTILCLIV